MQLVHYLSTTPNFGDDLNRDIWPALAPGLFADAGDGRGFVGIGTIIGMPDVPDMRLEVFSSGAGYDALAAWRGRDVVYHCVRGPVSARLCGLDPALALTDGAILAPLVPGLPDAAGGGASGGGGIAVVPHFQTLAGGGWAEACAAAGMRLVDPRQNPHAVISALAGADLVLTESLHGAILADSYGVPWRAFATSRNFGLAKWIDWTASVGLPMELTALPPPTAEPWLRFGKRAEPFGLAQSYGLEDAEREFAGRVAPAIASGSSGLKGAAKWLAHSALRAAPPLQAALGLGVGRTATALADLARQGPMLSASSLRRELTARMAERLAQVERSCLIPA